MPAATPVPLDFQTKYHFNLDGNNVTKTRTQVRQDLNGLVEKLKGSPHTNEQWVSLLSQLRPQLEADDVKMYKLFNKALEALKGNVDSVKGIQSFAVTDELKAKKLRFLEDQRPLDYLIPETDLIFLHRENYTKVASRLVVRNNVEGGTPRKLVFNKVADMEVLSIKINGKLLEASQYTVTAQKLIVTDLSLLKDKEFIVEIVNKINPFTNATGEGLYFSKDKIVSHCEMFGFSSIIPYIDKSKNPTKFSVAIAADPKKYPVVLSNGDPVSNIQVGAQKFSTILLAKPIPSYLFAHVAGNMSVVTREFTTDEGRKIKLEGYVSKGQEDKITFALDVALPAVMKWDKKNYGHEYQQETFKIVATENFNAGAMENQGCNIFNSSMVLVSPDTATDDRYKRVFEVVVHETAHDLTGNEITIENPFYIFFKEGFTSFRHQSCTADTYSKPVKRIEDVLSLWQRQFPEDASPNAHSVLPRKVVANDYIYSMTVYYKGAELFRMLQTMLGEERFRKATDLYIKKYSGQAVSAQDLLNTFKESLSEEDNKKFKLDQFTNWFYQEGTPNVDVVMDYDQEKKQARLVVKQSCSPNKDGTEKKPFVFPFSVGLLDQKGKEIVPTQINILSENEHTFTFDNVDEKPIPSLFRNFSAPVKVNYTYSQEELLTLMAHDTDLFNRYDAILRILKGEFKKIFDSKDESYKVDPAALNALKQMLADPNIDKDFKALALKLPSLNVFLSDEKVHNYPEALKALKNFAQQIGTALVDELEKGVSWDTSEYKYDKEGAGRRALSNVSLYYLTALKSEKYKEWLQKKFTDANNMTEKRQALSLLLNFYPDDKFTADARVSTKKAWSSSHEATCVGLEVHAGVQNDSVFGYVKDATEEFLSGKAVPNQNVMIDLYRTLYLNPMFHDPSGKGYELLADAIIDLKKNESVVRGYLVQGFDSYPKLSADSQALMKKEMEKILASAKVTPVIKAYIEKIVGK